MSKNNSNFSNSSIDKIKEMEEKQKIIDKMKENIKDFTNIFLDKKSNSTNKIIKTEIFDLSINSQDPKNSESAEKEAIKQKLSTTNFTECENILKKHYNISSDKYIILKKVEFDSKMDLLRNDNPYASKGVTFEFLNPLTFEKLNTSICSQSEIKSPMKIPFKQAERIKSDFYRESAAINLDLDLYNNNSLGYHSRCVKSNQLTTGADLSINYKRNKMFQNNSIECSSGCTYGGLDENKYVKCDCKINENMETSNNGGYVSFDPLPPMNYDIVVCYYEAYTDVIIYLIYFLKKF